MFPKTRPGPSRSGFFYCGVIPAKFSNILLHGGTDTCMFEANLSSMTILTRALVLFPAIALLAASCNSRRGESRDQQLEVTAETLEAKAEQVRQDVEQSADEKIAEAQKVLQTTGDKETAKVLEKDASVTREAGEIRAEQLEEQAVKVREQKE